MEKDDEVKGEGEIIDVKVTVRLGSYSEKDGTEDASTSNLPLTNKNKRMVKYNSLEGSSFMPAPMSTINQDPNGGNQGEVGFEIVLYRANNTADNHLANEIGDVMFRMEYPLAKYEAGTDKNKSMTEYKELGGPGDYSDRVQELYESGGDNDWPIKNR